MPLSMRVSLPSLPKILSAVEVTWWFSVMAGFYLEVPERPAKASVPCCLTGQRRGPRTAAAAAGAHPSTRCFMPRLSHVVQTRGAIALSQ